MAFDGHLLFFHGFQQGALRLGAGPVDFIGQQHLRKDRPWVEHKCLFAALVDRNTRKVAGHEVRGELHPRKLQTKTARQRMGQCGFSDPRHIVYQQVTTGQKASHTILDLGRFAHDHRVKLTQWFFERVLGIHAWTLPEFSEM